jgi:hypothetical protein
MPAFIDQFAACVERESTRIAMAFGSSASEGHEQALQLGMERSWLPLAEPVVAQPERNVFATDGSQAVRHFNNGWNAIICHALCVGADFEAPSVDVRFARNTLPEAVLNRYAGLLMRYLEIRAALDNVDRAVGGVMCLDGSLHTALPHLLYPLPIDEASDLPLMLLECYLDLVDACADRGILLVSLSKTSTGSMLSEALLRLDEVDALPGNVDLDDSLLPPLPSDMELVYRWASGAGTSRPLVLGSYGFGNRRGQLLSAPEQLVGAFDSERYSLGERLALLVRLASAPATVATYVRLQAHEDPIRLDVPASAVGQPDRICDTYIGWADDADLSEVLGHLLRSYGGPSVYHAALYVADQLVRMHNSVVDTAYLSIIRAQFGAFVQYDRSRRRFL